MKFVCPHCQARYSIAPGKVRGKVLKIRCKRCSYILTVQGPRRTAGLPEQEAPPQGQGAGPVVPEDGPAGAPRPVFGDLQMSAAPDLSRTPAPAGDPLPREQTRLSAAPDFDAVPAPEQAPDMAPQPWYLAVDGAQFGPMDHEELCNRIRRGEAGGEAFVWREGFDDWLDVAQVPDLPRHPPPPPVPDGPTEPPATSPDGEPAAAAWSPLALPSVEPEPATTPKPSPEAAPGHPRVPLLMKVTAAGGITAGLCGLILVVHILFFDGPRPVAPPPVLKIVVPRSPVEKKLPQKVDSSAGEAVTPPRTPERKVTPHSKKKPQSKRNRARRPGKQPAATTRPRPYIPSPRELVEVPRKEASRPHADLSAHVQALQRRDKKRMRSCYERAAKHDNSLENVKVKFALDIGGSGVVRGVDVNAGGNAYLGGCLQKIVKHWTFPAGEAQNLQFNIVFKGTPRRY